MSFLRRQVMDYKEQIKRANENNAFMIHNGVRAVELSETAARVEMDPEKTSLNSMGGVHGGGGCGASGEKRREDVCDHRFLLPVPALCRSFRAFVCGGQGHKKGTDRVLLPFWRLWKGFREAVCRGGFYVLLPGIRRMLPSFPPDRVFSACRGEAVRRSGPERGPG